MKISEGGGDSMASAYCLVYVKHDLLENQSGMKRILFLAEDTLSVNDEYSSYIKEDIIAEINIKNESENQEREISDFQPIINAIMLKYAKYYESVNSLFRANANMKSQILHIDQTNNFSSYLISQINEDYAKLNILDTIVEELYGKRLRNLPEKQFKIIIQSFARENNYMSKINLRPNDLAMYDQRFDEFKKVIQTADIAVFILESANEYQKDNCAKGLFQFFQLAKESNSLYSAIYDIYCILLLNAVCDLYQSCVKVKNALIAKELCEYIHLILPIKGDTSFSRKILPVLKSLQKDCKSNFKKSGEEYINAFATLLSPEINYTVLLENIPEKLRELNMSFDKNDYFEKWINEYGQEKTISNLRNQITNFYGQLRPDKIQLYSNLKSTKSELTTRDIMLAI